MGGTRAQDSENNGRQNDDGLNPNRQRGFGAGAPIRRIETTTLNDMRARQGAVVGKFMNTSLAAQGALAHRLQRRPRPIHKNAKSGAHPCSLPLGFNTAGWDFGGEGGVKKISFQDI